MHAAQYNICITSVFYIISLTPHHHQQQQSMSQVQKQGVNMSPTPRKKDVVEESEKVVSSNDVQHVPQNDNKTESSTRTWATKKARSEKNTPMIILALPAPSQTHIYERLAEREAELHARKRGRLLEEVAAMDTAAPNDDLNE